MCAIEKCKDVVRFLLSFFTVFVAVDYYTKSIHLSIDPFIRRLRHYLQCYSLCYRLPVVIIRHTTVIPCNGINTDPFVVVIAVAIVVPVVVVMVVVDVA